MCLDFSFGVNFLYYPSRIHFFFFLMNQKVAENNFYSYITFTFSFSMVKRAGLKKNASIIYFSTFTLGPMNEMVFFFKKILSELSNLV